MFCAANFCMFAPENGVEKCGKKTNLVLKNVN